MDLTPQQAFQQVKSDANTVLVDIRSSMEFLFVGHPVGAIHIPWIDEPDWDVNPQFTEDLIKALAVKTPAGKDKQSVPDACKIILICRSGNRSLQAGALLIERGFKYVSHVSDGFEGDLDHQAQRSNVNGWRFCDLPWEQC